MREEFERALCDGADLEAVARRLSNEVNNDRLARLAEIQHDLDFAKLIKESLTELPTSGPYVIARAYIRMFRKKYYPGGEYKLAYELLQEAMEKKPSEPAEPEEEPKEPEEPTFTEGEEKNDEE